MTKEERDAWFKEMAAAEAEALKVSSFLAGNPNAKRSLSDRINELLAAKINNGQSSDAKRWE